MVVRFLSWNYFGVIGSLRARTEALKILGRDVGKASKMRVYGQKKEQEIDG